MKRFTYVLAAALLLAGSAESRAQITRGAISGTVRDTSGAVVPGATVTVTNVGTNAAQDTVTDGVGFYRVAALEPGRYRVVTGLPGFVRVEQTDIDVRTASEVTIDAVLRPGAQTEVVMVTAEDLRVGLNRTNPTIGSTITARTVVELPLAGGRNINNLILTTSNALATSGQGTFAINGNRPRNNNYMIDGSDNNDISVTISTSVLPPEAVAEFQVLQNPYTVEFGRNSGGQINVITKMGSNAFRGDAWDYYTSSKYYSLTNIERANSLKTPAQYNRHQMGFDVGGPILRDRLFFYGLYQRDTQRPGARPGATTRTLTPAGFAALASVPLGAGQTAASRAAVVQRLGFLSDVFSSGATFRNFQTTLVNGVPIETGQVNVSIVDPSTYHTFVPRFDFRVSASDTITYRHTLNNRSDINGASNCVFGERFCGNQALVDTNVGVSNTHVFSGQLLNEARFSLVRRNLDFPENDPASPTATISGLGTIGGLSNFPQSRITDSYQFSDTFTMSRTRHTFKFGTDVRYNKALNNAAFNSKGTFVFNNLQDYINNNAFSFSLALQTASWDARQWQSSWFAQDDFRLTSDLTLNLGLRYELSTVPLGMFGATDAQSLGARVPGPVKKDTNNWAPRVGFAWTPRARNFLFGDGQAVLRGGFGVAYDVLFYNLLTVNGSNFPRVVTATVNNVQNVYPDIVRPAGAAVFNPLATFVNSQEDTESPESRFYSLTMQREVGSFLFEVGYSGSRGGKGINQVEANPAVITAAQIAAAAAGQAIPSIQSRRIFPQYGGRVTIPAYTGPGGNDVEARSTYNALLLSASRRLTDGLQFAAHYTYSRWYSNNDASLGEGGTDGSSQRPQNMFDYEAEWSRSQFDRPHRLALSYIWEIPGPNSGILSQILDGWQLSGVTSAQSGRPFTIVTGVDSSGDANTGSDRPNINPSGTFTWDADHKAFTNNGYYVTPRGSNGLPLANALGNGNAPRNSERGAMFKNTDLSLSKRFQTFGSTSFLFRVDALNVFNWDDYGIPVVNMTSLSFGTNANNWGRRSVNLSVKVAW